MVRWTIAAASCLALAILTLNADPGWPFHGAEASNVQAPAGSACPANAKPANLNFTLKDIDNKHGKDGLQVVAVAIDATVEKLNRYVANAKMNYIVLRGLDHDDAQDAFGP